MSQIYIHDMIAKIDAKAIRWTIKKVPADVQDTEVDGEATNAELGFVDGIFPSCIIVKGTKESKMFRQAHGRGVQFVYGSVSYISNDNRYSLKVKQA
jgi:hypothetical protein